MFSETQSLRQLFHKVVADCYSRYTGLRDPELTSYVADILSDFADLDRLYGMRDEQGTPIEEVSRMLEASDPVYGTAPSFIAERAMRKHIGDYSLFHAGMYPEIFRSQDRHEGELYQEIVQAGRSSYYVVSQFNVFEYAAEAELFERLAENFELCVYGLNKVRCEFDRLCLRSGAELAQFEEHAI
jgi:hypothetical protein